jgi:hypothetical protein
MEQMHRRGVGAGFMAALVGSAIAQGCVLLTQTELPPTSNAGAGGGQGSGTITCLDPSAAAHLFTIAEPGFCVVAIYDADASSALGTPTWGSHGGPLTRSRAMGSGSVDLVRWKLPAGATGKLSAEPTHIDALIPADAFVGDQAIDLPFFHWTALSWAGAFPKTEGELVMIAGSGVAKRYAINGPFSIAGVASDVDHGRVLLSSRSAVGDATGDKNGLYAADSCGTTAAPDLLPGQDPTCKPPFAVAAWGDASGPIAADRDGNVFAVMTALAGDQQARAFAAPAIARGRGPTEGTPLFTRPGFGSSLAAIAQTATLHGVVLFQPNHPTTYKAEDVIAQGYRVSGESVSLSGSPGVFLKLATSNTSLSLMRDEKDRLWVGAARDAGSTFVVIARSP